MKIFCISDDNDMTVGLRLSGIGSVTLNEREDIINKLHEICNTQDIGILAITQNVFDIVQDEIKYIQETRNLPLIVKIPNK